MVQGNNVYMPRLGWLRSDKDTHFTTAIVQNAIEDEALTTLLSNLIRIKKIKCWADQNLDYTIYFWNKSNSGAGNPRNVDLDIDTFCDRYVFSAANGEQIAGANEYYYCSGPIDIIYRDLDNARRLNASLVNRSAIAKIAGATGEFVLQVEYEVAY